MGKLIINGGGGGTGSDDVTAFRNHVLTGKTAVTNDSDDEPVMGTMPEFADKRIFSSNTTTLTKYEIGGSNEAGYYGFLTHNFKSSEGDKEGHFNRNSAVHQMVYGLHPDVVKYGELIGKNYTDTSTFSTGKYTGDGTIVASDVLSGKKSYSKGAAIIGTMANKGGTTTAATSTLDNTNKRLQLAIPANGFYNTAAKLYDTFANIASRIGLTAAKLATGNTILGIAGTYKGLGNATVSQVLSGSKFSTASLSNSTGTMPNRGTVSSALNCGGSYTIPAGYHSGSGRVTANSLSGQTAATATAGQIWTGKTAWVNGSRITGTLATQGGSTTTPGTANKTIVTANKIVTGNIVVAGDPDLRPENIKAGKNIFGVVGNVLTADDLIALTSGMKMGPIQVLDDSGGTYRIEGSQVWLDAAEGKGIHISYICCQSNGQPFPAHDDLIFKTTASSMSGAVGTSPEYEMRMRALSTINHEIVLRSNRPDILLLTKTVETSSSPIVECSITDVVFTEGSGRGSVSTGVTKMEIYYKGILIKSYPF